MQSKLKIEVSTFVNPYLFWVKENTGENKNALNVLQKNLQDVCEISYNHSFEEGEIVAVSQNNTFFRAVIEQIEECDSFKYLCWLIDYAVIVETNRLSKLPPNLRKVPPFAKQACLNNVVFLNEKMDYNQYSEAVVIKKPSVIPSSIVRDKILEIFSAYNNFEFVIKEKNCGILLGDILISDQNSFSLCELLHDREIMQINEVMFQKIIDHIPSYKESHMSILRQLSLEVNLNASGGISLINDLSLHEYAERTSEESYMSRRKRDSRSKTTESENEIDEDNKSPSKNSESSTEKKDISEIVRKKRMQMLSRLIGKKNVESDDESNKTGELANGSSNSSLSPLKPKSIFNETDEPKKTFPKNVRLIPAGASYSILGKKKADNSEIKKAHLSSTNGWSKKSSSTNSIEQVNISPKNDVSKCSSVTETETSDSKQESSGETTVSDTQNTGVVPCQLKIKPHCNCNSCHHYTNDITWKAIKNEEKIQLEVFKPAPLFKNEDVQGEDCEIQSICYSLMSKIEKQKTGKILVHGVNIPQPLKQVSSATFHECVHRTLRALNYKECNRMQSYTWPAILRQHNVFIINNPKTGKTMSYLPVMCSLMLEKDRYKQLSNFNGPIVTILCANSKNCEDVHDMLKLLLAKNRVKVVLGTYPLQHINMSHTDVLITMPSLLLNFLKNNAVNLKRLCHLIIEDADVILKRDSIHMDKIFNVVEDMLTHRVCAKSVQLIVVAEHWNNYFRQLMRKLAKVPVVCIGNFFEAARYGNVEFSLKFLNSACKQLELKMLLKDRYNIYKTIIICDEDELEEIKTTFLLKGIDGIIIKNDDSKEVIFDAEEQWNHAKPGEYIVLVCTDYVFNTELTVTTASILIHYSLPSSWTRFTKRYSCFLETNRSIVDEEDKIKLQSVVFTDESSSNKHMPKFLKYFSQLNIDLPEGLLEWERKLKAAEEEKKISRMVELCPDMRLFGKPCRNNSCDFRHVLDKTLDESDFIPKNGKVKFKIINIVDVTHFSVKLIEYRNLNGEIRNFDDGNKITERLTELLKQAKNTLTDDISKNYYAYYDIDDGDGVFYRCKVLYEKNDEEIKINLVDTGAIFTTLKTRLFELPAEFNDKPSSIVDVYIANYIPPYGDDNFSAKSYFKHKLLLEESNCKNMLLSGDIYLQLGSILWLKNVVEEVELSDNTQVYPFQLSKQLLQLKVVEVNDSQLNNLYALCKESGIQLPVYEAVNRKVKVKNEQVAPHWAFINEDSVEDVIFCAAMSPNEFYVRLNKYSNQLYNLQKEMQEQVRRPSQKVNVIKGKCYLAKDRESDDYSRVIVLKREGDQALCFFVDFGDEAILNVSELRFLPNHYIIKLPFQTIQCSLHGVASIFDEWQEDAINALYEYSLEPNTDIFRTLYVKSCSKFPPTIDKQYKYSVLLKDGFGEKKALINKLLVDCGVANSTENAFSDFEIPVVESETPDSEEEEEEVDDIKDVCLRTEELYGKMEEDQYCFDADDMEVCINDAEDFFLQLLKSRKSVEENKKTKPEPTPIQTAPAVDYLTPDVFWSQTDHIIKLSIKITDVVDYTIALKKERLFKFSTNNNGKKYVLNLMFYEKIKSYQHTVLGPQVRITLVKAKDMSWPRLLISKEKARNVHFDISSMQVEDEVKKRILTLPKDPEESDGDDYDGPMYIVASDQDSDFDEELEDLSDF